MMKVVLFVFLIFSWQASFSQSFRDSLTNTLTNEKLNDTSRLNALDFLSKEFTENNPDSAMYYAELQITLAKKTSNIKHEATGFENLGVAHSFKGMHEMAIEYLKNAFTLFEKIDDKSSSARAASEIGRVRWSMGDYFGSIPEYEKSMAIAREAGDLIRVSDCLNGIAYNYFEMGLFVQTLQRLQQSLKISEELKDDDGIAWDVMAIGAVYIADGNYSKGLEYQKRSLEITERLGDRTQMSFALGNISEAYYKLGDYSRSLEYGDRSLKIAKEVGNVRSMASAFANKGAVYLARTEYAIALDCYRRGLELVKGIGNKGMECEYLHYIGKIQLESEQYQEAITNCERSFEIAKEINSLDDQLASCKCLYQASKALDKPSVALAFHEKILHLQDSINYEEVSRKLQQMEFRKQFVEDSLKTNEENLKMKIAHQKEVAEKEKSSNLLMAGGLFLLLVSIGLFSRNRYVRRSKAIIEKEKDRSDNLLLNILPAEIAEELKEKGEASARDFEMVSILFSDFKGFTELSSKLNAADLVKEINHCFKAFDGIMEKHGVEKIKTIGDAYMAAGGLPVPTDDSVKNTVLAALEMQDFIAKRKAENDAVGKPAFEMRVGIHTGPVVAGIVGVKKFQYDIWGDTVNTASRMESAGETGKVNISQATYELLNSDPDFSFESRGKIEAKGKGTLDMYFVKRNEV